MPQSLHHCWWFQPSQSLYISVLWKLLAVKISVKQQMELKKWSRHALLSNWDTPQKCHFTLEFCMLNFLIAGCPCEYTCT
jgi:hypothetical protein